MMMMMVMMMMMMAAPEGKDSDSRKETLRPHPVGRTATASRKDRMMTMMMMIMMMMVMMIRDDGNDTFRADKRKGRIAPV